jgi:chromosomal replication initiation ATPase DnaA
VSGDLQLLSNRLHARIGDTKFQAWFTDVEVERFSDGVLVISAPTTFARNYIRNNFVEDIACVWRSLHSSLERVEVTVRS